MSSKQKVLLLGATGETWSSILEGLLEADQFVDARTSILVRPASAEKPAVQKLHDRGIQSRLSELSAPEEELTATLSGIDILIGKSLVAPPNGVMILPPCTTNNPQKEEIYNEIKRVVLPYTILDVGFWHQISFPPIPSGRLDYIVTMGIRPTIHTRIIVDDRTINKYVYPWSDVLSENEIFYIVEELSGEKIAKRDTDSTSSNQTSRLNLACNPQDLISQIIAYITEYQYSKYVRGDNQPSYTRFLGYLDARELYPDFKPISFRECFHEVLDGNGRRPYQG
ncbi:hypothetical protein BJX61DRAFT_531808 [Aspergillus egyptiacus]|nr:hypothetical protein BJX61DRAFT_531808 [Aspergillus egyptiacus]